MRTGTWAVQDSSAASGGRRTTLRNALSFATSQRTSTLGPTPEPGGGPTVVFCAHTDTFPWRFFFPLPFQKGEDEGEGTVFWFSQVAIRRVIWFEWIESLESKPSTVVFSAKTSRT